LFTTLTCTFTALAGERCTCVPTKISSKSQLLLFLHSNLFIPRCFSTRHSPPPPPPFPFPQELNEVKVSEKVFTVLAQGAVPVYLGPRSVYNILPHKDAIVYAADYAPEDLITYLKHAANDFATYKKHFQWTAADLKRVLMERDCGEDNPWFCQACERVAYTLAQRKGGEKVPEPWGGNKHVRVVDAEGTVDNSKGR
jgi:hypothetical protein